MRPPLARLSFLVLLLLPVVGCGTARQGRPAAAAPPLDYTVDLTDRSGDSFKVTLRADDLGPANAIYQFASTAPGTYQVMDMGRYVRAFEAVDATGRVVPSEQVSTNQWRIAEPEAVVEIRYEIAETWDTPVERDPIYLMAGTSIEDDHTQINGQAVFGYPDGMQGRPLRIRLLTPAGWTVGTALAADGAGRYLADDYDHVVDSPILAGRLSHAEVDVEGTDVDIYTYSKTGAVHSDQIRAAVEPILEAAGDFLGELPVDRYAFLFHFEDVTAGAWEHSYSSTYAFAEADFPHMIGAYIPDVVAHEFFHIVTPLNIHSEIIERFDFVRPTPSEHVWLYEGVTEWMAHASQLRGGLIGLDEYLGRLSDKLEANDRYDPTFSLSDISLQSYSAKGQQQWGNIYQRGAVVAALLNIELLAHSGGRQGLREVILELAEDYGPDEAFDEAGFFDEFAGRTHPDIRAFFEAYVRDTQPLPLAETFAKVGVEYLPEVATGERQPEFGAELGVSPQGIVVTVADGAATACGVMAGDLVAGLNGQTLTMENAREVLGPLRALSPGETFDVTLVREGASRTVSCAMGETEVVHRHVLRVNPDATPEQVALREAWTRRLGG